MRGKSPNHWTYKEFLECHFKKEFPKGYFWFLVLRTCWRYFPSWTNILETMLNSVFYDDADFPTPTS